MRGPATGPRGSGKRQDDTTTRCRFRRNDGPDGLLEGKLPIDLRTHQAVNGQLADVRCSARSTAPAVLLDPEFRCPVKSHRQCRKNSVLLEGRADRQRSRCRRSCHRDQLAQRRHDIAEQLHLRAATASSTTSTPRPSVASQATDQVFLGDDHRLGTQFTQVVTVLAGVTGGDHPPAQRLASCTAAGPVQCAAWLISTYRLGSS